MKTKRENPYAAAQVPAYVKTEDGMTYFTFLGSLYRTDSVRYVIEGQDGAKWNRTHSARVSAAAKQILEA